MFKSVKKALVGVLAASLMLSSVVMAADSPASVPETGKVNVAAVKELPAAVNVTVGKKATSIAKNAVKPETKTITIASTKKVTVAKKAFAKANAKLAITVNKNKVTFKKGAFGKADTSKMVIKVKGLKKTSKEFKAYKKALAAAGFKGKVKAVK